MEQRNSLHDLEAPPRVRAGDTVAIISPSAPAVAWWPHRVARGRAYLESLGLQVRLMPNAGGKAGWVSASPQARAADIHAAFLDDRVRVVLASIGGNHANQILPHLDFDLLAAHPKILQGYSDVTVLLWAIAQRSGLRTFHGPSLALELAEFPAVLPDTDRFLRAAWFEAAPIRFERRPNGPTSSSTSSPRPTSPGRAHGARARAGSRSVPGPRKARSSAAASRRSAGTSRDPPSGPTCAVRSSFSRPPRRPHRRHTSTPI